MFNKLINEKKKDKNVEKFTRKLNLELFTNLCEKEFLINRYDRVNKFFLLCHN